MKSAVHPASNVPPNLEEVLSLLSELPLDLDDQFVKKTNSFVEKYQYDCIMPVLESIVGDENHDITVRYNAFYSLTSVYRRYNKIAEWSRILDAYEDLFKASFSSFGNVKLMYLYKTMGKSEPHNVIKKAYEYYLKHSHMPAIAHTFARSVVTLYSDCDKDVTIIDAWHQKAMDAVDDAIDKDKNYAKFYCTKGMLYAAVGKYKEALELIKEAISREDPEKKDYAVRIGEYQQVYVLTLTNQSAAQIQAKVEGLEKGVARFEADLDQRMKDSSVRHVEILGFFAAIMSFTIGSIQIISNQTLEHSVILIATLFIGLSSAFGVLTLFLRKSKNNDTVNIVFTMFFVLCLLSLVIFFNYK